MAFPLGRHDSLCDSLGLDPEEFRRACYFLSDGMMAAGGGGATYPITNSIRLNGTSDYLSKILTTGTTTSGVICVKRGKLGVVQPILDNKIYFNSSDQLVAFGLTTAAVFREPECWIFLFWNGTGIYNKGTLLTGTGTYTPAAITNPRLGFDGTNYFSGVLAHFAFWNGSSVSYQGTSLDANGQTVAARPTGIGSSYSFLEFKNSGALGTDTSGNGNNWTVTGSPVQTVDTPTNNYATWDALTPSRASQLSIGNLKWAANNVTGAVRSSIALPSSGAGTFAFEVTLTGTAYACGIGICNDLFGMTTYVGGSGGNSWGYNQAGGCYYNGSLVATYASFTTNDVIGVVWNPASNSITLYKNGTLQGTPWTGLAAGTYFFAAGENGSATNPTYTANFGATALVYSYGSAKALCTANLPAVAIQQPSKHFKTVLDTGANIKATSEAQFTYFMAWIKDRANSQNHQLIDTVRGTSAVLQSNTTAAEATYSAPAGTSVGWVWNAGAAAVTNNAGIISSQVSVNAAAGMSVVTYTGNGVNNQTVGHGLGATPAFIIFKARAGTHNWLAYHKSLTATAGIFPGLSNAAVTSATYFGNNSPTSTTFYIGNSGQDQSNANGVTYVAYCFAEIPGYSKFGSLSTNATTDNAFAYCYFQPAFILIKQSDSTSNWVIYDVTRNTYNVMGSELYPNLPDAEATGLAGMDITASGFKIRTSTGIGVSGTWVYAAFARFPFGGSNVAPCPAR